jgi:hypothetical protein
MLGRACFNEQSANAEGGALQFDRGEGSGSQTFSASRGTNEEVIDEAAESPELHAEAESQNQVTHGDTAAFHEPHTAEARVIQQGEESPRRRFGCK